MEILQKTFWYHSEFTDLLSEWRRSTPPNKGDDMFT